MTTSTLSKENLFASLRVGDIHVNEKVPRQTQDGDGSSLHKSGAIYYDREDYAEKQRRLEVENENRSLKRKIELVKQLSHMKEDCIQQSIETVSKLASSCARAVKDIVTTEEKPKNDI
ncbi:hypothetical protein K501DRAFT_273055 [Backusella circina FSU 941]|nr:hypothetical protein K501DRAFT_273055 [Backusella circina FSU 941]